MKTLCMTSVLLLACMAGMGEEEGRFVYEYPGYNDTPLISGTQFRVHQQDRPQPPRVKSTASSDEMGSAPSDAIVLFDGTTLEQFQETQWTVRDGILVAGEGGLITKKAFGNCQYHIEWRTPDPPRGEAGNMGNSGVFFMGLYELQIYDSFSSKIYADGSAAALYGQTPPLVNVCRQPGEWQSFDVIFTAPVFRQKKLVSPGLVTAFHNGVLVHHNTEIKGPTAHQQAQPYKAHAPKLPISIQGHGSPVAFRNIWIRELD
jgi:hypothetical protein